MNSFDSGATTKITINNRKLNRQDFEKAILIPLARLLYVGKPGEVKLVEPQATQTGVATFTEDEIRLASDESQVLEFMVERGAFETALTSHRTFSMQLKFAYN